MTPTNPYAPEFQQLRGPQLLHRLMVDGGHPTILIAGSVPWPFGWTNKGIIYLGVPGCGKSVAIKAQRASLSPYYRQRGALFREFVIDPTGTYWDHAARTLPPGVPMLNLSPHFEGSRFWDVARETNNEPVMLMNLVDGLMGVHEQSGGMTSSDPFWPRKARVVVQHLMTVFAERAGPRWRLADVVRALWYPEFLAPILAQSASTRGSAAHEITGKMGKGITATASAELNQLGMVAAFSDSCGKGFTFREQFDRSVFMHLAFDPNIAEGYSRYSAAMAHMLYLVACRHGSELNRTFVFADEAREMRNFRIPEMLARGRQFGLSLTLAAQGIEGLVSQWGEKATKEMMGLMQTIVAFASTPDTAEYLCKMLGKRDGIETNHTTGTSEARGRTEGQSFSDSSSQTHSFTWNGARHLTPDHFPPRIVPSPAANAHPWAPNVRWIHTGSNVSNSRSYTSSGSISTTTTTSASWTAKLSTRDTLVPWDLVGQRMPDPHIDELDCYVISRELGGVGKARSRWLHVLAADRLRAHAPSLVPKPPAHGTLRRFTRDDLQRLGLDLTDELLAAFNS
jgi:hypothetical protein